MTNIGPVAEQGHFESRLTIGQGLNIESRRPKFETLKVVSAGPCSSMGDGESNYHQLEGLENLF